MSKPENTLNGKVVLITGSTRGIGREVAIYLARLGCNIAFCYRTENDSVIKLVNELSDIGVEVLPVKADVSSEDDVVHMFTEVEKKFSRLDILINNAGITRDNLLLSMSLAEMQEVVATNLIGTMLCSREALKLMLPKRAGNIINLSSVSAVHPNRGQTNYAATKGAVDAFTRALAVEVCKKNIRVNAIAPGAIETEMTKGLMAKFKKELMGHLLSKRIGRSEDICKAVHYLADPDNDFVTGEVLNVNGGLVLA